MDLALTPNTILRLSVFFTFLVTPFLMKLVSIRFYPLAQPQDSRFFWQSPLTSTLTWNRSISSAGAAKGKMLKTASITWALVLFFFLLLLKIAAALEWKGWMLGYFVLPLLLLSEKASVLFQLLLLRSGRLIPTVHRDVLYSSTISDFWRRYNVWVNDWFYQILFRPLRANPLRASFFVFFCSGILHELVINLPLFLVLKINIFGGMMIYFLLQWLAVGIDHYFLPRKKPYRWLFFWIVVVGPIPLVANQCALRVLGFWPD